MNASAGEVYEITVVKEGQFINWMNAVKSDGSTPAPQPGATAGTIAKSSYTPTPAAKSTYETPEERAKKQIYIVRQSSISNAIDLLSAGAKAPAKVEDILSTAKQFEEFVFGDLVSVDVAGTDDFKDLDTLDDVPY